mmetsp:Transcript_35660/g.106407  ORF Transcript_35660/g.106407 Transcript_35660/m.106407 type:complete len:160 (-) Transcript_35660:109-588(-)
MSTKLVKKLLRQTNALDVGSEEQPSKREQSSRKLSKKRGGESRQKRQGEERSDGKIDPVAKHVQMILQYDKAIARYADSGSRVVNKRLRDQRVETKKRKKAKMVDGSGVGQGFSGGPAAARLEHESTFNKKKHARRKEMESMRELARKLQKSKKRKGSS